MVVKPPGDKEFCMNIPLTPVRLLRYPAQQFPAKTAVVCQDRRFTYAEFSDRVWRMGCEPAG